MNINVKNGSATWVSDMKCLIQIINLNIASHI